jgi:16S rRNA G966 N2-methylase RsmD
MYTAMKYWGKKPHNIWGKFIESYCPPKGVVLDPFSGSAVAAFEAVKIGRKAIAFDLNPLTAFIVEVYATVFDEALFVKELDRIINAIESDPHYIQHYVRKTDAGLETIINYRWLSDKVVKRAYEVATKGKVERFFEDADQIDIENSEKMKSLELPFWFPDDQFQNSPVIRQKFINDIGGNSFKNLWTRRNLYILSKIFHEINTVDDKNLRLQLLFGFIQTLHLTSKMVVPRNETANRDFSGSWGRADYMIRRRQMEQNPLNVFQRSCIGKQGVISALSNAQETFGKVLKASDASRLKKVNPQSDINYGSIDVADLSTYLKEKSVDFVITDPPYAGLVPYLDLSLVWLVWLQKVDKKYRPELLSEITVKKGVIGRDEYKRRLQNGFKQIHRVLKDEGYLIVTFHHKKLQEWNDFVQAVKLAGFKFDKVTHQYNRRSGESNVSNPYGTSGADFYIRCVKQRDVDFSDDQSGLENFIVQKTIEIIAKRNEPTPYEFIIAGLLPEMLQAGFIRPDDYKGEILKVLKQKTGSDGIFTAQENIDSKAGDYWWFREPQSVINFPDMPLKDRVEETVLSILRRKVTVKLDDVLSELFQTYPNGLTPDPRNIKNVLEKYAFQSNGKWKKKDETIEDVTEHTRIIELITKIGKKIGLLIYIGKREQPEFCESGVRLRDIATLNSLASVEDISNKFQKERVEMIDTVWVVKNKINCVFEVENSTNFSSAIIRGSNIDKSIHKFMIIPIERELELKNYKDPLFVASFVENNWKYMTYTDIERFSKFATPSLSELVAISKEL